MPGRVVPVVHRSACCAIYPPASPSEHSTIEGKSEANCPAEGGPSPCPSLAVKLLVAGLVRQFGRSFALNPENHSNACACTEARPPGGNPMVVHASSRPLMILEGRVSTPSRSGSRWSQAFQPRFLPEALYLRCFGSDEHRHPSRKPKGGLRPVATASFSEWCVLWLSRGLVLQ